MTDFKDYANLPDSRCEKPSDANFASGLTEGEPLNSKNENWEKRELAKKLAEAEARETLLADEVKKIGKALEGSILETEYRSYATPKDEVVYNTLRAFSVDYVLINTESSRIKGDINNNKVIKSITGIENNVSDQTFIGGYEIGSTQSITDAGRQMRDYFNAGHGGDYGAAMKPDIGRATTGKYAKMRIAPNTMFCMNPLFRTQNKNKLVFSYPRLSEEERLDILSYDRWRHGDNKGGSSKDYSLIERFANDCLNNQYTRGYHNWICVVPVIKYINENVIDTEVFFNTLDRGDIFTIIWSYPKATRHTKYLNTYSIDESGATPTCYVKCSLPLKKKYHGKNCYSAPVVDSQFGEHIKTQSLDEMTNMPKDIRYDETDAGLSGRAAFKRAHGNPYLTHVFDTVVIPPQKTLTSIVQQQGLAGSTIPKDATEYRKKIIDQYSQGISFTNEYLVSDVGVVATNDDDMNSIVDVSFSSDAYIRVKV